MGDRLVKPALEMKIVRLAMRRMLITSKPKSKVSRSQPKLRVRLRPNHR